MINVLNDVKTGKERIIKLIIDLMLNWGICIDELKEFNE